MKELCSPSSSSRWSTNLATGLCTDSRPTKNIRSACESRPNRQPRRATTAWRSNLSSLRLDDDTTKAATTLHTRYPEFTKSLPGVFDRKG